MRCCGTRGILQKSLQLPKHDSIVSRMLSHSSRRFPNKENEKSRRVFNQFCVYRIELCTQHKIT